MNTFTLERISDPTIEPVTLDEAIRQVREFSSLEQAGQDELTRLITNAREWVEDETGQALIDQTWRLSIGNDIILTDTTPTTGLYWGAFSWAGNRLYLRRTPVLQITKFVTVASDGTETDVDTDTFTLCDAGSKYPYIYAPNGGAWTTGAIIIEFRAGYADLLGSPTGSADDVPARFKQAILLHVEAHYDRDEKMMEKLMQAACNNVARLVAHLPFA